MKIHFVCFVLAFAALAIAQDTQSTTYWLMVPSGGLTTALQTQQLATCEYCISDGAGGFRAYMNRSVCSFNCVCENENEAPIPAGGFCTTTLDVLTIAAILPPSSRTRVATYTFSSSSACRSGTPSGLSISRDCVPFGANSSMIPASCIDGKVYFQNLIYNTPDCSGDAINQGSGSSINPDECLGSTMYHCMPPNAAIALSVSFVALAALVLVVALF